MTFQTKTTKSQQSSPQKSSSPRSSSQKLSSFTMKFSNQNYVSKFSTIKFSTVKFLTIKFSNQNNVAKFSTIQFSKVKFFTNSQQSSSESHQVLHRGLRTAAASLLCCSPQPEPGLKSKIPSFEHLLLCTHVGSEKLAEACSLPPPSPLSLPATGHCDPPAPHLAADFSVKTR